MIQDHGDIPSTWKWRYDPCVRNVWEPYTKTDYEVVGYKTKLCCAECKNKYYSWQEVNSMKLDDVRRLSGQ